MSSITLLIGKLYPSTQGAIQLSFLGTDTAAVVMIIPIFTYHGMQNGKAYGSDINPLKGFVFEPLTTDEHSINKRPMWIMQLSPAQEKDKEQENQAGGGDLQGTLRKCQFVPCLKLRSLSSSERNFDWL